jgi:iron complex transport system ATP-binding protein
MIKLQTRSLSLGFAQPLFRDLDFSLESGRITAIMGPNGCGKSTLIRALARLKKPQRGTVELNGQDIWQMSARDFAAKVACVPQSMQLPDELKVFDLVTLGRNPHQKWWQSKLKENELAQTESILQRLELTSLKNKYLNELSGGERQRAIIAMALNQAPSLLLLDEPTTGLDFHHQVEILQHLKAMKESCGLAIGIVLHDLNFAARLADQVLLIKNEKLLQGDLQTVFTSANLKEFFQVDVASFKVEESHIYYLRDFI